MKKLNNETMKEIKGGATHWGIMAGVGAFASFLIGVIDGWMNPKRCNN